MNAWLLRSQWDSSGSSLWVEPPQSALPDVPLVGLPSLPYLPASGAMSQTNYLYPHPSSWSAFGDPHKVLSSKTKIWPAQADSESPPHVGGFASVET